MVKCNELQRKTILPSKRNKVTLERAEFSEYFPEEYAMEQMKDWILEMMKKERCV